MESNQLSLNPVNSKTISGIAFEDGIMYVQFSSGVMYKYFDISFPEYSSILEDISPGSKLRRIVSEKLYEKLSAEDKDFKRIKK